METTLMVGGTGRTGRRVARRLQERGVPCARSAAAAGVGDGR